MLVLNLSQGGLITVGMTINGQIWRRTPANNIILNYVQQLVQPCSRKIRGNLCKFIQFPGPDAAADGERSTPKLLSGLRSSSRRRVFPSDKLTSRSPTRQIRLCLRIT